MPAFDAPDFWNPTEERLFDDFITELAASDPGVAREIAQDEWLGFLHHEALWDWDLPADQRAGVYAAFHDYVMDTYGIDWDDYYDWDDFRSAYDEAH